MKSVHGRPGRVSGAWLVVLGSLAAVAGLVVLLKWNPEGDDKPAVTKAEDGPAAARESLTVFCAAGVKAPVEAVARAYEKEFNVTVHLQYGGSQTLLSNIQLVGKGDLYIPGDDDYIRIARTKGLVDESIPLADMRPVIAVRKDGGKNIAGVADLLRDDVKVSLADPTQAAVGRLAKEALTKTGEWERLAAKATVFKPTVPDVAADVKIGAVDAGIVFDATVAQMPDLRAIEVPAFKDVVAHVAVGVLRSCRQPAVALHFARYLAASDKGLPYFAKAGWRAAEGDQWVEKPELKLFSGAMLRSAIQKTLEEFEKREGATIVTSYAGCGLLVAKMKAGERPDAYFACDTSFMTSVSDLFLDQTTVSRNPIVIAVKKGNPSNIRTLADLARPGLRVGLGDEQMSALGYLVGNILRAEGLHGKVSPNVVVRTSTGDDLVAKVRLSNIDAVVVYTSNAALSLEHLDTIPIELPSAKAAQPYAVGGNSKNRRLAERLLEMIRSRESQSRFTSLGFEWTAPAPTRDASK